MNAVAIRSSAPADIYDGLDTKAQGIAQEAAERIRKLHGRVIADVIDIGRELLRVKEAVGHGHFLPWIETELRMSRSTANNYMNAAVHLGGKCSTIGHLPLATVYKLAAPSTPDPVREQIVERIESGEAIPPQDIALEIAAARQAAAVTAKRERAAAIKNPEARVKAIASHDRVHLRNVAILERAIAKQAAEREARRDASELILKALPANDFARIVKLFKISTVSHQDLIEARNAATIEAR